MESKKIFYMVALFVLLLIVLEITGILYDTLLLIICCFELLLSQSLIFLIVLRSERL